jgi:5-formyltetrahydrofolate cyclo-ligase
MTPNPVPPKAELRRRFRAILRGIPAAQRAAASAQSQALLRRQKVWKEARSILFYSPLPVEIDLSPLLAEAMAEGKTVALPRFVASSGTYEAAQVSHPWRDCAPGQFGIVEPAARCPSFPLMRLDLVLTPGLGFDVSGRRLGRGRGFYDRLLAAIAGAKCGVAFDQQIAGQIPAETHDVCMNYILTPTRWVDVSESVAESQ